MKLKIYITIFISIILTGLAAQKVKKVPLLEWNYMIKLPSDTQSQPHIGLAGPITGIVKDHLIISGGANFPDQPPWEGGKKVYYDMIYLLSKTGNKAYEWKKEQKIKLPVPLAYSAVIPYKKGLICIGGENLNGPVKSAFKIVLQKGQLKIESLPDLPKANTAAGVVIIDDKIYLAGGNNGLQSDNQLIMLDMKHVDAGWKTKNPLPFPLEYTLSQVVNDGKNDCIYLIGGRYKMSNDVTTKFSDKILKYNPSTDQWQIIDFRLENGETIKLAAGPSVSTPDNKIILLGGDSGEAFNKTELLNNQIAVANETDKELLINLKKVHLANHSGFNRKVYLFNPLTNNCSVIGEVPYLTQVTTTAFWWKKNIVIPSGEIKPGKRTPDINTLRLSKQK